MNPETEAILNALLENRKIIEARLDALDSKFDALDTKVGALDTKVGALDTKVGALDSNVNALDTKLESVAADVAVMKEQLRDINARDRYLMHKTGELEAEIFVLQQRQKT